MLLSHFQDCEDLDLPATATAVKAAASMKPSAEA
jgi:hypothetical protein